MTGEEMERAIEFLLKNQAAYEERQDRTDAQVAETSRQLQVYAETQSQFIGIVTTAMTNLSEAMTNLAAAQQNPILYLAKAVVR